MKDLLVVCFILMASNVEAFKDEVGGECGQEFMRIVKESQGCSGRQGYNLFKIDETLAKAATGNITKYQVRRYITNTCRFAINDTECIRNIKSNAACGNSSVVKLILNINTIIETQVGYLCSNPPDSYNSRYSQMIKKDGPYCIAANQELKTCMKTATDQMGLGQVAEVLKADMCALLKTHAECAYHYDHCRNKKVKLYMIDVLNILNEKYNCSPDV